MLGLGLFGTTWWIISAIIAVILLIIVGISYSDSFSRDFDDVVGSSFVAILVAVFWPFALVMALAVGVIAGPIFMGKYIGKMATKHKERKRKKAQFMNRIDKMKKKRGVE